MARGCWPALLMGRRACCTSWRSTVRVFSPCLTQKAVTFFADAWDTPHQVQPWWVFDSARFNQHYRRSRAFTFEFLLSEDIVHIFKDVQWRLNIWIGSPLTSGSATFEKLTLTLASRLADQVNNRTVNSVISPNCFVFIKRCWMCYSWGVWVNLANWKTCQNVFGFNPSWPSS